MRHALLATLFPLAIVLAASGCDSKKSASTAPSASASTSASTRTPRTVRSATISPTSTESAAIPTTDGPPIPIVPMKVTLSEKGAKGGEKVVMELSEDGSFVIDGKPVGKVVGNRIEDLHGGVLVSVGKDGKLASTYDFPKGLRMNAKDEMWFAGATLVVSDTGVVTATKDKTSENAKISIEGFKPRGKRVLLLMMLAQEAMPAGAPSHPAPSAEASAHGAAPEVHSP